MGFGRGVKAIWEQLPCCRTFSRPGTCIRQRQTYCSNQSRQGFFKPKLRLAFEGSGAPAQKNDRGFQDNFLGGWLGYFSVKCNFSALFPFSLSPSFHSLSPSFLPTFYHLFLQIFFSYPFPLPSVPSSFSISFLFFFKLGSTRLQQGWSKYPIQRSVHIGYRFLLTLAGLLLKL